MVVKTRENPCPDEQASIKSEVAVLSNQIEGVKEDTRLILTNHLPHMQSKLNNLSDNLITLSSDISWIKKIGEITIVLIAGGLISWIVSLLV